MVKLRFIVLVALSLIGCTSDSQESSALPAAVQSGLLLSDTSNLTRRTAVTPREQPNENVPLATFGELESNVIGLIGDIKISSDSLVYILDIYNSEIRVIDVTGALVGRFGSGGQGPGEFFSAKAIALKDSLVYVADEAYAIHVFKRAGRAEWEFIRKITVPSAVFGLCLAAEEIFVHVFSEQSSELIYKLEADGRTRSFGEVVSNPPTAPYRLAVSESRLACTADNVYLGPRAVPELHSFEFGGERQWISALDGLPQMVIEATQRGSTRRMPPEGKAAVLQAIVPMGDRILLSYLENASSNADNPPPTGGIEVLLSGETGEVLSANHMEMPVWAMSESFYVRASNDPFPRIDIYGR